jgi:hypothetical protein
MSAKEMEGQQKQEITEIRKSIIIDATPEVVFKAITETNELTNGSLIMLFLNQMLVEK